MIPVKQVDKLVDRFIAKVKCIPSWETVGWNTIKGILKRTDIDEGERVDMLVKNLGQAEAKKFVMFIHFEHTLPDVKKIITGKITSETLSTAQQFAIAKKLAEHLCDNYRKSAKWLKEVETAYDFVQSNTNIELEICFFQWMVAHIKPMMKSPKIASRLKSFVDIIVS